MKGLDRNHKIIHMIERKKHTKKPREGLHVDKQYWGDIINYLKKYSDIACPHDNKI